MHAVHSHAGRFSHQVLACKRIAFETRIYETRQNFRRRVEREIHLLNKVDHPNIVQYFEADWPDESTAMVYMEYITGGNLSEYIEANSRLETNFFCHLSPLVFSSL